MHRVALRALRTTTQHAATSRTLGRPLGRPPAFLSLGCKPGPGLRRRLTTAAAATTTTASPSSSSSSSPPSATREEQETVRRCRRYCRDDLILLQSSVMFLRRGTTYVLLSTLVGFGAWFAYGPEDGIRSFQSPASTNVGDPGGTATSRRVLVLGPNDLQTGTFVGDGPITKTTADGRRVVEMMTPEQATKALRSGEESIHIHRGEGVVRYDVVQLPSNDPIEDDHAEQVMQVLGNNKELSDWMFWGIFDGHRGWTTSATLRQSLIAAVSSALNETYLKSGPEGPSRSDIDSTIKSAFLKLDDEIVNKSVERVLEKNSRVVAAEALAPAIAGSCALLSFYDARTKELRVACTGDSRAVLGRRGSSGKWTATALSSDQTGSSPEEAQRLRDAHPGEPFAVSRGRVLGQLEPTRAFGDASYKWTAAVANQLRKLFFGVRSPSPHLLTPPYVTAEPVVTTTKIQPEKGDFLVMATDGLWEMLTNEEVVGLVGKWLDSENGRAMIAKATQPSAGGSSSWASWLGFGNRGGGGLPVESGRGESGASGQKAPIRRLQWGMAVEADDHYVIKDKNAATHLIRNALGGNNEEQVCSLLTLPAPTSRRYRDDLTVQVIFFGQGEATGEITVNTEATSPHKPAGKSKA